MTIEKKASEVRHGDELLLADGGTARVTWSMFIASPRGNAVDFTLDGDRRAVVPASATVQVVTPPHAQGH